MASVLSVSTVRSDEIESRQNQDREEEEEEEEENRVTERGGPADSPLELPGSEIITVMFRAPNCRLLVSPHCTCVL